MTERITSKSDMYRLLAAGLPGNTCRQWFDVDEWMVDADSTRYDWWGVRTLTPGGPCRLNCPVAEVEDTAAAFEAAGHRCNISVMLDRICRVTLWADVWDSPTGLIVYGIEFPPEGGSWRALMPYHGRHWEGLAARMLLRRHLNANSHADVDDMFDRYPGHVIELSALDRCLGVFPHRNSVTWEIRGTY